MKRSIQKGFTLIELMIVVALIAILLSTAAILVPVVFVISNPGASIVAGIAIGLAFLGLCRSI